MKYEDHPQFKDHRRWLFDQVWHGGLVARRSLESNPMHQFYIGHHDAMVTALAMFADRDPDRIREITDQSELWHFITKGPSWMAKIKRQVAKDAARYEEAIDG